MIFKYYRLLRTYLEAKDSIYKNIYKPNTEDLNTLYIFNNNLARIIEQIDFQTFYGKLKFLVR